MTFSTFDSITSFRDARKHAAPQDRLRAVHKAAQEFRERFMVEPQVVYYRSINLIRAPYPTRYAYAGVYTQHFAKSALLHLLNRLFVVQFKDAQGQLRTLLASPTDHEANRETPFFKRLTAKVPRFSLPLFAPTYHTVESALKLCGIKPEQVDYITYDHLHTQDIRKWLATRAGRPAYFPKAKLLVHRQEWASAAALLPSQADWYCPNGIAGVDPDRVILFDGDIQLGAGLALIHTPGHTEGNHSIVCRVPNGIRVTSENGVGADAYEPKNSRVNAIRRYALATGAEVILNGNTLENSNDQYISMVQEKTIAGPSANPDYPNMAVSSECTPYWLFPGNPVSYLFGEVEFGKAVIQ